MARRASVRLVLIAVLAAVLAAAPAAAWHRHPAPVTPNTPLPPGGTYLALGDSVTFGYQEPNTTPPPNYHNPASLPGYPELLGRQLHLAVTNLSCPGETSGSLINVRTQSNGCENAYRKAFPLHASYSGSQLSAGVAFLRRHPGVRLVSLMIGANDLFLCENTPGCLAHLSSVISRVAANVRTILRAVRSQAGYKGQIVIVRYYSTDYTSVLTTIVKQLNLAVVNSAKPFHIEVADGFGQFQRGSVKYGNKPCLAALITQLNGTVGDCGVHPTYAGSSLLAAAVLSAIRL